MKKRADLVPEVVRIQVRLVKHLGDGTALIWEGTVGTNSATFPIGPFSAA